MKTITIDMSVTRTLPSTRPRRSGPRSMPPVRTNNPAATGTEVVPRLEGEGREGV